MRVVHEKLITTPMTTQTAINNLPIRRPVRRPRMIRVVILKICLIILGTRMLGKNKKRVKNTERYLMFFDLVIQQPERPFENREKTYNL